MALERLSQVTDSGISTGIVLSNASVTGVLTATSEFNVGSGLTITSTSNTTTVTSDNVNITGNSTVSGNSFVDGKLGIGTDNPFYKLEVRGDTNTEIRIGNFDDSEAGILLSNVGSTNRRIVAAGGDMIFRGGSSTSYEHLRVTSSGNVGIGSTIPQAILDVSGEVRASGIAITESYPTIRPSLNLNFTNSRSLDSRITFSRASDATYVDKTGLIKNAVDNEPRIEYNPTTGECLGLLIEAAATNLFTRSEEFDDIAWNKYNCAATANQTLAPDGTNTADKIAKDSSSTVASYINLNISITSGTSYSQSVFAKAGEFGYIQIAPSTGFNSRYQNFDLINGVLGSGDVDRATITAYPNGWYRCTVTEVATSTVSGRMVIAFTQSATSARIPNIAGSSGDGFYLWGAQIEATRIPTSYIPTSGAAVGRAVETALIDGQSFTDFYNQQESTVLCNFTQLASSYNTNTGATGNERAYRIRAATGADTRIDYVTYNQYHPYIAGDGSQIVDLAGFSNLYGGLENRTAVRVKANDFASALNGEIKATATSGSWPPSNSMTEVQIGSQSGGQLNGHVKSFIYYPLGLADNQLIALTL